MSVEVNLHGPVFDGRAAAWSDELVKDLQKTVADQALVEWESDLEGAIRHSTPRYQLFLHAERRDRDEVVNDGYGQTNDLKYGPWLEGVGSRNAPVTRFPGYHALAGAFESVKGQVDDLCKMPVEEYVERVNHE